MITIFDVVFRPLRTSRKMFRMMKDIELNPALRGEARETADSNYVIVSSNVLMPAAVFNMVKDSFVVMDSKWDSGRLQYYRRREQKLSTHKVSFEEAVTMLVAERLETSNAS